MTTTRGAVAGGVLAAAVWLVLAPSGAGQTFIVQDGRPRAAIVIAEEPPRMVRLAAEELRTYVEKISGAALPIATQPVAETPVTIYIGRSRFTDQLRIGGHELRHGAFRIVSGKDYLALLGRDSDFTPREPWNRGWSDEIEKELYREWDKRTGETWGYPLGQLYKEYSLSLKIWDIDERGSLNAVYEFLRMQGVRWYLPDPLGEIVPHKASIELPKVDRTVTPDFALRWPIQYGREFVHEGSTRDEALWRLRLGEWRAPEVIGLTPECGLAHGINPVHSRPEIKKAHPDWYLLVAGRRDTEHFGAGRPCLSSPGLFEQNVKYVRAMFDIFDVPLVSVMPQDGYIFCECGLCKGKDTPERGWEGQMSDYVWDYVNRVAQEVYKTHPNKKVSCYAYGNYLLPPAKIAMLSPNVQVGICQSRATFVDPGDRRKFADLRRGWLAKMPPGSKLLINDYYLHSTPSHTSYVPFFFPRTIAQDLRSMKGIALGEFTEVYRDLPRGIRTLGMDHLNLYVTARCWWDANLDIDALLEEYYTLYYGPAREEMKAFIEYSETNLLGLNKSAEKIDKVFDLLAKAQAKAPAESVYARRIALIADYIQPLNNVREQLARGRGNVPLATAFERNKADIRLDGKLDDKFWEGLWSYDLSELQTGRTPFARTSFRVGWAEDALYFGISCIEPDTKNLAITGRPDDGNIWNGDCIEILLETQTHSYYQLAINPAGVLTDLDRKKGFDTLWSSGAEVAAFIGDGYWSIEVRLPVVGEQQETLDRLHCVSGRKPVQNYPWYFNLCRQRVRENGIEASAFSPTGKPSFHEVIKFGRLYVRE